MGLSWQFMDPPVAVAGPWLVSGERVSSHGLHTVSTPSAHCLHRPAAALGYDTEPDSGEAVLIALLTALGVDLAVVVAVAVCVPGRRRLRPAFDASP
jgi:hypothetical protein